MYPPHSIAENSNSSTTPCPQWCRSKFRVPSLWNRTFGVLAQPWPTRTFQLLPLLLTPHSFVSPQRKVSLKVSGQCKMLIYRPLLSEGLLREPTPPSSSVPFKLGNDSSAGLCKRKRPALGLRAFDPGEERGQTRSNVGSASTGVWGLRNRRESWPKEWSGMVGKSGNF